LRNYRDLQVWNKAHQLTVHLYRMSRSFPRDEIYGLTAQLRRATASIGANLAEGCGRQTDKEMARFVRIALGSASELDYHLLLTRDLGLLAAEDYQQAAKELTSIRKMLRSFLSVLEKTPPTAKAAASS
jgi:four helix bundle protein